MDLAKGRQWPYILNALLLCSTGIGFGNTRAAAATTFFVRTSGNDANDGLTPDTAFQSIRYAGRFLLNPGDRVVVGSGEYFEGNIEPRRSGDAGEPIAFIGDTSGALTGDPAGPVVVRPDDSRVDETTGFIVFGKHHVHIEGFTVIGAVDAGIQVRPSAQTGGSSADITIIGNVLQNCRRGIDMHEVERVVIMNNEASDNDLSGVRLRGTAKPTTDATVSGNRLTGNTWGILTSPARRGHFEDNTFEGGTTGVKMEGGGDLVVARNSMRNCTNAVSLVDGPTNVAVTDNVVESCRSGIWGRAGDALLIARNQMSGLSGGVLPGSVYGAVTAEDNEVRDSRVLQSVVSVGNLTLRRNLISSYVRLEIVGTASAYLADNQFEGGSRGLRIIAPQITLDSNRLLLVGAVTLRGDSVIVSGNQVEGGTAPLSISAADAVATNNDLEGPGAGLFYVNASGHRQGSVRFNANHFSSGRGISVRDTTSATDAAIADNRIDSPTGNGISVQTLGSAEITANQVLQPAGDGISVRLDQGVSTARIEDNVVTGGDTAITIKGARSATLSNNQIADPARYGLLVRNTDLVDIGNNDVSGSGNDVINVAGEAILLGDCDRDGIVTAEEIERAMDRLFVDDVAGDCSALGPNHHGRISVASLLAAIMNHSAAQPGPRPAKQVQIRDNHLQASGGAGILAYSTTALTIQGNAVLGSR